jgi:hypothetical protein
MLLPKGIPFPANEPEMKVFFSGRGARSSVDHCHRSQAFTLPTALALPPSPHKIVKSAGREWCCQVMFGRRRNSAGKVIYLPVQHISVALRTIDMQPVDTTTTTTTTTTTHTELNRPVAWQVLQALIPYPS